MVALLDALSLRPVAEMREQPFTPEEYERRKASLEEDVRVLEAHLAEAQEHADMLRERGHEYPADVLEASIQWARNQIAEGRAKIEEAEDDAGEK
jgi:DNA-binding transcriptional MerR regulator